MKHRILITRRLPPDVEARAALDFDVVNNPDDHKMSPEELVAKSQDVDALLVTINERMTREVIGALPARCRVISTYSTGTDHIDLKAARERGIKVAHAPHGITTSVAEIAMLLILAAARRAYEGESIARSGRWAGWSSTFLRGMALEGKRLGIFGMGRIGQAIARRARAFDMEIHYYSRRRRPPHEEQDAVYHSSLAGLLEVSQVLVLCAPASVETRHMLNSHTISRLPRGAIVVNTARGSLIEDDALVAALRSGHVAAAGLDVFNNEPHIHPAYSTLDNVFLLPHLGAATMEARNRMGFDALDNITAVLSDTGGLFEAGDPSDWLRPYMRAKTYGPGEILFRKGDPASAAFYIVSGLVDLLEIDKTVGEGCLIGETALFTKNNQRSATARCKTLVQATLVDQDEFKLLFRQNPDFAYYTLRLIVGRLQENVESAQDVAASRIRIE